MNRKTDTTLAIKLNEITIGDLQDLAEQLRRASGVPYYVKSSGDSATLFVTVKPSGTKIEPTFGDGMAQEDVIRLSRASLFLWIEQKIEGVQLGVECAANAAEQFGSLEIKETSKISNHFELGEALEKFTQEERQQIFPPIFNRVEFCSGCGALVFGKGKVIATGRGEMKKYDDLHFDRRERHEAECPRPEGRL